MAQRYGSQRQRNGLSVPLMTLGILVLGIVGGALILHATGVIEIPLLAKETETEKQPDYSGRTLVPRSTRPIAAYAEVTRDDIMDRRGNIAWFPMLPADVTEGMLTRKDLSSIIGRVLKRDKPIGYVFTQSDFYPKGTRPGPTAGVPPGKRAMRLKASAVPGLHGLKQFDRFDLVMTVAVELQERTGRGSREGPRLDVDGPYGEMAERPAQPREPSVKIKRRHAEVKTIVEDGLVVQPVTTRSQIGTSSSLLRGTSLTSTPIEEIIIAVDPDEVASLNLALAIEAQLQVAMRTGQVLDADTDEGCIPDIEVVLEENQVEGADEAAAVSTVKIVEVIKGGEKHLMAVPRRKKTPEEKTPEE